MDLTGCFTYTYGRGIQYILVVYNSDGDKILVESFKNDKLDKSTKHDKSLTHGSIMLEQNPIIISLIMRH